jgi:hypothetical protein
VPTSKVDFESTAFNFIAQWSHLSVESNKIKIKILKRKKNPGSPLEVTC